MNRNYGNRFIRDANATSLQNFPYNYDPLQRLTSSAASGGTQGVYALESYSYSASSGNLESKAGVSYSYAPQSGSCPQGALSKPHAVTSAGTSAFCYDLNGNMVRRTIGASVYNLAYDAENHLISVSGNGLNASFVYDGDGRRVKGTVNGVTTTYIGDAFEWSGSTATMKTYYAAGGTRLALRTGVLGSTGSTLNWLLGDHLGSTNITANSSAIQVGKLSYKPWGRSVSAAGRPRPRSSLPGRGRRAVSGCTCTAQDGTTLIFHSSPNLIALFPIHITFSTGIDTPMPETIPSNTPIRPAMPWPVQSAAVDHSNKL